MTVEFDGATTAAYLHDETTVRRRHLDSQPRRARRHHRSGRLNAGQARVMPAGQHQASRAAGRRSTPRPCSALWFEEGDGVALLERGTLLAVIPGWSDMSPRHARVQQGRDRARRPFGWSLDDAIEGLGPRVERATEFWQLAHSASGSGRASSSPRSGHLPGAARARRAVLGRRAGRRPSMGISERPPTRQRPLHRAVHLGMSAQRMPVVEQVIDDPGRVTHGSSSPSRPRCRPGVAAHASCGWPGTRGGPLPGSGPVTASAGTTSPSTFPLGGGKRGRAAAG